MVRIVHFSDWHGYWRDLPPADLYLCTGDMIKNHTAVSGGKIVVDREETLQRVELGTVGSLRKYLGSPSAPVVVVRGNHDYVDLGSSFGGEYFEVNTDSSRVVEYFGLKIGGYRGAPPVDGWIDGLLPEEIDLALSTIPNDLDILVSHGPPKGILSASFGSKEYFDWFQTRFKQGKRLPKLCCFGHIHEGGGEKIERFGTHFSNASLGSVIIDLRSK